MLDRADENAPSARPRRAHRPKEALDREIVGLCAAACEDDLAGPGAERRRDLLPGLLDHSPRPAARVVQRRRVAELPKLGRHDLDRLRNHRRRRGMVKIGHNTWCWPSKALLRIAVISHDGPKPSRGKTVQLAHDVDDRTAWA